MCMCICTSTVSVWLSSAADKKTAVGVVEGNMDEARELVSDVMYM